MNKTKAQMIEELKDVKLIKHNNLNVYPKSVITNIYEEAIKLGKIIPIQQQVVNILKDIMKKENNEISKLLGRKDDLFEDVKLYTNKTITYESNNDPSKGWTGTMSSITDKPNDSNCILLVTYDGAGYDYLSYNADYGGPLVTKKFEEALKKKFGSRFNIEHSTNWAFEVYEDL